VSTSPKNPPPPKRPEPNATVPGALYDRFGPIPVPDAKESNTESVWALFEDVKNAKPQKPEATTDFAPTNFEERLLGADGDDDDDEDNSTYRRAVRRPGS
jgi:hypothetical protein